MMMAYLKSSLPKILSRFFLQNQYTMEIFEPPGEDLNSLDLYQIFLKYKSYCISNLLCVNSCQIKRTRQIVICD